MLYKHSFSILCGHLNLNQKRKKFEFGRLPVKPTGKPVKPAGIPVRTGCTVKFEFKFEFHLYRPVSSQTGPVYRYRTAPVWPDRSVSKTLMTGRHWPRATSWPPRPAPHEPHVSLLGQYLLQTHEQKNQPRKNKKIQNLQTQNITSSNLHESKRIFDHKCTTKKI